VARADLLLVILHACVSDQGGMSGWNPTAWIQAVITRKHKFVLVRYIQTSNKQNWARKYVPTPRWFQLLLKKLFSRLSSLKPIVAEDYGISRWQSRAVASSRLIYMVDLCAHFGTIANIVICVDIHHLITSNDNSNAFPKLWLPCN
jgi:hypothetical protein